MKKGLLFFSILLITLHSGAQTSFVAKGKIEFERKTNTHRLYFSEESDSWGEEFKKLIPQFRVDYFDLYFTPERTVYKPGRENTDQKTGFFESPAIENYVYKDLGAQTSVSQKRVFETQFLVSDSLKKLTWKIENETRTIAGYECRKAVTWICDSVVVVAFYTDEILPSSGPESFGGLPGMILGLAVPRLYTTWFATKVELTDVNNKALVPPAKGKKANDQEMVSKVNAGIKDWGEKYRSKAIWFLTL